MTQHGEHPRRYPYPYHELIIPALRVLFGIPSSISSDGEIILKRVQPPPRVIDASNIPPASPFVLIVNHYDHPRLGAWWGIALILSAIKRHRTREPRELHFAMAREWWYPGGWGRRIKQPLTAWLFNQLSKTYGTILLPPVLGNDKFRGEGTFAIRKALSYTRGENPQLVGLAPEGRTGEELALVPPPPGAGLFLLLLTHDVIPILPVGLFEDDDCRLTASFGVPFDLRVPRDLPRAERDQEAARRVMVAIGRQLPARMWGAYRSEIEK